jgi:hypothetical protein
MMNKMLKLVIFSISVYIVWVFATYIFEGRTNLLHTYDPLGRLAYTIVANILIGTVLGFILLKPSLSSNFVTQKQLGFQSPRHIIILVAVAASAGFLLFSSGDPVSLNPVVIVNVFSQTLPTSIAEVVVCWIVIGTVFESLTRQWMEKNDNKIGKNGGNMRTASILSVIIASLISIVLFGVYHFAHSPPFNQPNMVIFLMIPAILTSVFYFGGREVYSTITIHNILALIGVSGNIDVTPLAEPLYPIMILARVCISSDYIRSVSGTEN